LKSAAAAEAARERRWRLAAAYNGARIADAPFPFRHGVALGVDWFGFAPLYAGLGCVFTPPVDVTATPQFELQALPISAHAGYRSRFGPLAGDLELGLVVEPLRSSAAQSNPSAGLFADKKGTKVLFALAPRLRGEWLPVPDLGLYAAVGIEVLLNNFSYVLAYDPALQMEPSTLLRGHTVRPVVELGIAFYP
jgi:hypothetical protein